ncbi:MAG: hypothetical protein RBS73_10325 [Prolixibacteraceae bacterium]|jgi:hypothetical protein|nr:hypothetical protein [Prolixibacteraceae bacterium]
MKRTILTGFFIVVTLSLFAQNTNAPVEIKKSFGTVFTQNGKNLTPRQLAAIMQSDPKAAAEMKIAKSNYSVGSVFGFAGGFLIGWPVGTAIGGGKPNWAMAGIGAGLVAISIPFSSAYTKHAKNAVGIYNEKLKQTSLPKADFKFGLTCNGVGLRITF